MKKILICALSALCAFFAFYLIGCFYSSTFVLSKWNDECRAFISFFGGLASLVSFIVCYNEYKDDEKKR